MNRIITILILVWLCSCNDSIKNNSASDNLSIEEVKPITLDNKIEEKENRILDGKWKLIKVNAPWDIETTLPENEIWNFETKGLMKVYKNDSKVKSIEYEIKRTLSGFSSDSIWVIQANFQDSRISTDLEIWIKENKMELIDQCDDCYSFEFER